MKIRVYYEDTDAGGIVYHTRYINFCERARSEVFFARGMMPENGEASGFIVRSLKSDFLASASLGDLLEVKSRIITLKKSTVILQQDIYKAEEKVFSMEIRLAYISEGRVSRIPDDFRTLFENML